MRHGLGWTYQESWEDAVQFCSVFRSCLLVLSACVHPPPRSTMYAVIDSSQWACGRQELSTHIAIIALVSTLMLHWLLSALFLKTAKCLAFTHVCRQPVWVQPQYSMPSFHGMLHEIGAYLKVNTAYNILG